MTREKKELLKKLSAIDEAERLDYSIGDTGPNFSVIFDEQRTLIYERLDNLTHKKLNDFLQGGIIPNMNAKRCNICNCACNNVYYDAKTCYGPWANMCTKCFNVYGVGLGLGLGQMYRYNKEQNKWIKERG